MHKGAEPMSEFVIARCQATKLFEAVEESLDEVPRLVSCPVGLARRQAVAARRNNGFGPRGGDGLDDYIVAIPLVGDDCLDRDGIDQRRTLRDIGDMTAGEDQSQRIAQRIDAGVDLRGQSAARPADRLIATVFFGSTGSVLVGANHRRVDEQFLEIGVILERLSDTLPNAAGFPSGKPDIHRVPVAKCARQVTPRVSDTSRV